MKKLLITLFFTCFICSCTNQNSQGNKHKHSNTQASKQPSTPQQSAQNKTEKNTHKKKHDLTNHTTNTTKNKALSNFKHSIIVTGFGPFSGVKHNPSWMTVSQLPDSIDNVKIIKKQIPVEWVASYKEIESLVKHNTNALAIISVGVDPRSSTKNIRIEAGAVNQAVGIDDTGKTELGQPLVKNGPVDLQLDSNALTQGLTLQNIVTNIKKSSKVQTIIPGTLTTADHKATSSAGRYICNETFYTALWLTKKANQGMYASFIHIPNFDQVSEKKSIKVLTTYIKYIIEKKHAK